MTGNLLDSFQAPPYFIQNLSYSPYGGRLMVAQNVAAPLHSIDPDFVPISSYVQAELGGIIQFVAPSASVEKLSGILADCAVNSEIVTTGLAFLTAQQYSEFIDWVNQQPSSAIPETCAADLLIIVLTIVDNQPSPTATFTPISTETATLVPSDTPPPTPTPTTFPETAVLDDFNRADGDLGGDWSGTTGSYGIIGNQVAVAGDGDIYWNAAAFSADQREHHLVAALCQQGSLQKARALAEAIHRGLRASNS